MINPGKSIWFNGKLVPWEEANVHVLTHSLHYGLSAFEGIRAYKQEDGSTAIFRLKEHLDRLIQSAQLVRMEIPYHVDDLINASIQLIKDNNLESCYLRPLVFLGSGEMGLHASSNQVHTTIIAWKWGTYLGSEGLEKGIRVCTSPFQRPQVSAIFSKGKIAGHYVNSILAKRDALSAGFDEAIMLDVNGYVTEGTGENLFMIRNGEISTPPDGAAILHGITRDTVIKLFKDQGIQVQKRAISRDEIMLADEVFLVGTAAEVTPVREIDFRKIGNGNFPMTKTIQKAYFDVVEGRDSKHQDWITKI